MNIAFQFRRGGLLLDEYGVSVQVGEGVYYGVLVQVGYTVFQFRWGNVITR